ncbi:MipA/OmpV family protein [PVC group bacterium]|nr:MipA/OmpV family protein [PVC group bacterium]
MTKSLVTKSFFRIIVLLLFFSGNRFCYAESDLADKEELPLWEAGVFGGAVRIPHYWGSDEYSDYLVPIPYFIYRGKRFRSNREGMKGLFFSGDHLQMDLSLSGSPPVPRENEARDGMSDIGAVLEMGPALKWSFIDKSSPDSFFLRAATRAALAFDVHDNMRSSGEGFRGSIDLSYLNKSLFKQNDFRFGGRLLVDFTDKKYANYFYGVSSEYVRDSRPYYKSEAGYAGFSLATHATKRLSKKFSVGAFASWINIKNAVFENSPLVKTKNNYIAGFALIWKAKVSKRMAPKSFKSER